MGVQKIGRKIGRKIGQYIKPSKSPSQVSPRLGPWCLRPWCLSLWVPGVWVPGVRGRSNLLPQAGPPGRSNLLPPASPPGRSNLLPPEPNTQNTPTFGGGRRCWYGSTSTLILWELNLVLFPATILVHQFGTRSNKRTRLQLPHIHIFRTCQEASKTNAEEE